MSTPATTPPHQLFLIPRLVVFSVATALAVIGARSLPETRWVVWLSIAAVLVAIWHGAFDGVLAEEVLQPRSGAMRRSILYLAYVALGAGVLLLWWRIPVVALAAFLLYSALHFGAESEQQFTPARLLTGFATGFVPIAASCHWWPQQVTAIFTVMLRGSMKPAAVLTTAGSRSLWPIVLVALLGSLQDGSSARLASWALIATELVLFHGCVPVVAFALFFCLWHTPEHLLSTSTDLLGHFQPDRLGKNLRGSFAFWLVSVVGVAIVGELGRHELIRYVGILFIALSALTVPHMVLAELCRRQRAILPVSPRPGFLSPRTVLR